MNDSETEFVNNFRERLNASENVSDMNKLYRGLQYIRSLPNFMEDSAITNIPKKILQPLADAKDEDLINMATSLSNKQTIITDMGATTASSFGITKVIQKTEVLPNQVEFQQRLTEYFRLRTAAQELLNHNPAKDKLN